MKKHFKQTFLVLSLLGCTIFFTSCNDRTSDLSSSLNNQSNDTSSSISSSYNSDSSSTGDNISSSSNDDTSTEKDFVTVNVIKNLPEGGEINGIGEYSYNSIVSLTATSNSGFSFVGWFDIEGKAMISSQTTYNFKIGYENIELLAKFKKEVSLTIDSNNNEVGLFCSRFYKEYHGQSSLNYFDNIKDEVEYKSLIDVVAFSKDDTLFLGWYNKDNNLVSSNPVYSFIITEDCYLEAKWNLFKIEYDLDGGIQNEANPTRFTLDDSFTLYNPTKEGYTFLGWYNNNNKMTKISKGTIGNLDLKAKWQANKNTLTVESEDESKGTVEIVKGSGYSGEETIVKATPKKNFIFRGWYKDNVLVSIDKKYTFNMPITDTNLVGRFCMEEDGKEIGIVPSINVETNTITYGLYPQTHVNDKTLISNLDKLTTIYYSDWYFYEENYYAKSKANLYSTKYTFSDGTSIDAETTYWFKCEPIEWRILESNNEIYSLVSNVLLDAHRYKKVDYCIGIMDKDGYYVSNYKKSEIRSWLNNEFYNSSLLSDTYVQTIEVDNSKSTTDSPDYNKYACENTFDKVYLLSYQDYNNSNYFEDSSSRICKVSDYAIAKGAYYYTDSNNYRIGQYWTRSPFGPDKVMGIKSDGEFMSFYPEFDIDSLVLTRGRCGYIRPSLTINL